MLPSRQFPEALFYLSKLVTILYLVLAGTRLSYPNKPKNHNFKGGLTMFNSKRIIFLIGLLSIVTLTGALLAGPAFASKPASEHKAWMCHYNGEGDPTVDSTGDGVLDSEFINMGWQVQ